MVLQLAAYEWNIQDNFLQIVLYVALPIPDNHTDSCAFCLHLYMP